MKFIKHLSLLFLCFPALKSLGQVWHNIPSQQLHLNKLVSVYDTIRHKDLFTVNNFEISSQITFGLYKTYLEEIKRDSGRVYYLSQLPDSTITSLDRYTEYLSNPIYNSSPVAGIRWEAAMNFCKWMTIKNNPSDSIQFIYSLPKPSQWVAAKYFLDSISSPHDFSKDFSDWSLGTYFEGAYRFSGFTYDVLYFAKNNDALRDKRKRIIGGNSLFIPIKNLAHQRGYYQNQGYRYISFRLSKQKFDTANTEQKRLLEYFGLKPDKQ